MNPEKPEYIAFMAHLPHKHGDSPMIEYLEEIIQEYDIGGFIIGEEHEPYNHYHFTVEMSAKDYHKFSARIFKKQYNLRGKATKGLPRQYGKVQKIDNIERMKAYTLKEGVFKTNLNIKEIEKLQAVAHEKEIDTEFEHKICRKLKFIFPERTPEIPELKLEIIKILIKDKVKSVPTKGKINKIVSTWYWSYNTEISPELVYESLFGSLIYS